MNAERYTRADHNTIDAASGTDYEGIGLNGCSGVFLLCNSVTANTNASLSYGIVNNVTANSALYCNYVSGTNVGIQHYGGVSNFNLYGNEVSNNDAGLRVGNPNSTSGNFFGTQPYHGNIWDTEFYLNTANTNGVGAMNYNTTEQEVQMSLFTYRTGTNPRFRPIVQLQPGVNEFSWFNPGFENNTYSCNDSTPTCDGEPGADIDENLIGSGIKDRLDTLIVRGELQTSICSCEIAWNTKKQLYAKLSQAEEMNLSIGTLADSFMLAGQTESFGILTDFEREVGKYLNVSDSTIFAQIQTNRTVIKSLADSLRTLNNSFNLAQANNQPTLPILQKLNSVTIQHLQADSLSRVLVNEHETNVQQYYAGKINELSGYSFSEVPAVLLQQINLIYLKWLENGSPEFTTAQKKAIFTIANNCARCGGEGVFFARSLYGLIDSEYQFNDDTACANAENREQEDVNPINYVKIFPNPAQTQITVELPQSNFTGSIQIINYLGQIIFFKNINTLSGKLSVNTNEYSNGYYQMVIESDGVNIFNSPFIIQR